MGFSMVAKHAQGKFAQDRIFGANDAAVKAAARLGKDKVTNATIGAILDENEQIACLPAVEKAYRSLPVGELVQYAGIAGLPEFLEAVVKEACGKSRPDSYISAVATTGGTGAIHHVVWNYASEGDAVLTTDWYWDAYSSICRDMLRKLDTYKMFDENNKYNIAGMEAKVRELAARQDSVILIINTPAHNPTGYRVSDQEWDVILAMLKAVIKETGKKIVLFVDMAYLDYGGEREEVRRFIKKFENMPSELLVVLGYSMSKGFTLYGQRTGAMIGVSSDESVIKEFKDVNQYSSRATWSNINRACMRTLVNICKDPAAFAAISKEREELYYMIKARAGIFTKEAGQVGLNMVPYVAGFFLSMEAKNPEAVCEKLKEDNIYAVPLVKGVRIAVCAVPQAKMKGMAAKIKKAFDAADK